MIDLTRDVLEVLMDRYRRGLPDLPGYVLSDELKQRALRGES
jgi:hypothetical protein